MKDRDFQRARVYAFERAHLQDCPLDIRIELPAIREFCRHTLHEVGHRWRPPKIKDGRGTRIARGGRRHLNLPRWARTTSVICHELAHHIAMREHDSRAHGRLFMRAYLQCLAVHGWDADALAAQAENFGVKI